MKLQPVPRSQISFDEGALELMNSPSVEPYIKFQMAISQPGVDIKSCLAEIAKLPLQERYVWRIASALKWGFADYDTGSVAVDRDTLTPEDLVKVTRLLTARPYQFCRFLSALLGVEKMEQLVSQALADAKQRG